MLMKSVEPLFKKRSPDWVQKQAWQELQSCGFPTKKWDAYRYISLKQLEETPNFQEKHARFEYQAPEKLIILPLEQAKDSYGPLLNRRYTRVLAQERDPFFFLNHALHQDGLFIYVPPGIEIKEALSLKLIIEASDGVTFIQPKIEIFLGKGAKLTTVSTTEVEAESFWNNANLNVTVEEGASYSHYDLTPKMAESWDFLSLRAQLKRDSRFNFFSYQRGARVLRRDLQVSLEGENSEVALNGMALLEDKLQAHVNIRIDHKAPHARSHQFFKNVLSGQSRSSFEGKIYVEKEAQKTEAYQLNNNLLLSNRAAAFSKPNLEILADDVKASHGATIAQPDEEQLFYLQSRGLNKEEARHHLIQGFCRELIHEIPLENLRKKLSGDVNVYL